MDIISKQMAGYLGEGSWIRDLFEKGNQLKKIYGEDRVFDFSLGNPVTEPPANFREELKKLTANPPKNLHGYISNQGLPGARETVARFLGDLYNHPIAPESVVMTSGAGGALNVALKSILNPNDEVIVLVPYFVEYKYYIMNAQGIPVYCNLDDNFQISVEEVASKITPRTKGIIVNTPHNPTGCILSRDSIYALGKLLKEKEEEYNSPIYILYDAPYTQLTYDDVENVNPFAAYHRVIYASSFSKDLGLAGERIGFIAVDKEIEGHNTLVAAFTFANRTLGFVNAPALMQNVLARMDKLVTEQEEYRVRRDLMVEVLKEANFEFHKTQGGFFIFPKSPIPDDVEFCRVAAEKFNVLIVPGTGFGRPGYFRMSFSVNPSVIEGAREPLKALRNYFNE